MPPRCPEIAVIEVEACKGVVKKNERTRDEGSLACQADAARGGGVDGAPPAGVLRAGCGQGRQALVACPRHGRRGARRCLQMCRAKANEAAATQSGRLCCRHARARPLCRSRHGGRGTTPHQDLPAAGTHRVLGALIGQNGKWLRAGGWSCRARGRRRGRGERATRAGAPIDAEHDARPSALALTHLASRNPKEPRHSRRREGTDVVSAIRFRVREQAQRFRHQTEQRRQVVVALVLGDRFGHCAGYVPERTRSGIHEWNTLPRIRP